MTESLVTISGGGTTFQGPDAVALFRAIALRSALKLYAKCGIKPNRAWTPTAMLQMAAGITQKRYKRGQYETAAADVEIWINTMKAAIPVEVRE